MEMPYGQMQSGFPVLMAQNVSKVYQMGDSEVHALKSMSLGVRQGEMIAIMGTSGSGKSTLLQIMGCLDKPTTGKVFIDGQDVGTLPDVELAKIRNRKLGFIFQAFNLMPHETASNNVEVPLQYAGLSRKERRRMSMEALGAVGLGDRTDHRPAELSGGQRQRVAIARAIVNRPLVILADEPTGALDVKSGHDIMAILHRLNAEGRTIVMVTHDPGIAQHAQRIIKISDGRVIEEEVVSEPRRIAEAEHPPVPVPRVPRAGDLVAQPVSSYQEGRPRSCSRCDTANRASSRYCRACGSILDDADGVGSSIKARLVGDRLICGNCGVENRPAAKFCLQCGWDTDREYASRDFIRR